MAFIDKNSTAYQEFSKWQKWLSRFSQNAWVKLLYALVFLTLCAENIIVIFNLNFINFNKYVLTFEIIYLNFIQYGWLYSWYTIVNNKKHCSKSSYTKQVTYWQIFTIIVLLSSIFALFNSNNLIGILTIDLAYLLSWLYYEIIICHLHIMSDKTSSIKKSGDDIALEAISIFTCAFVLFMTTQIIFEVCNQPVLLIPMIVIYNVILSVITAVAILAYIVPRYFDTDLYTINWQDVEHYNSNPKSKLQSLSYDIHYVLNGQYAHAIYSTGIILVISSIFEYLGYALYNSVLKDRLENIWVSLLATLQNMALPIFIGIGALIIIAAFYVYLFRQDY